MDDAEFAFVTDTATLCAFDLGALTHRLHDDPDWWSMPEEELREVNCGNALFVGLGHDGKFRVVLGSPSGFVPSVSMRLSCPTGRVFIGAAEEVTSDGLQPTCVRGGRFVQVTPGTQLVAIGWLGNFTVGLTFHPLADTPSNNFHDLLRLPSEDREAV